MFGVGLVWKTEFYPQVNSERLAVSIFVEEDSEAASNLAGTVVLSMNDVCLGVERKVLIISGIT